MTIVLSDPEKPLTSHPPGHVLFFGQLPTASHPHLQRMNKLTASAAIGTALLGLSTTGCFKNESKSTVNADGSGKFTMVMELNLAPIMSMMGASAGEANPLGDNRSMLVNMVRSMNSSVDVWTDAKVETTKAGATKITLSGLTKDFTATGDIQKALSSASPDMAEKAGNLPSMKFINSTKDATGNWIITMAGMDEMMTMFSALQAEAAKDSPFEPGALVMTEEEVTTKIAEFRPTYDQFKPIVAALLTDMSISTEMEVGGTILESNIFKKIGANKVSWTFTGEQLIDMADGIIADKALPKKVAKLAAAFNEGPKSTNIAPALKEFISPYMTAIYGGNGSPRMVIKPGEAAFDYAAEAAKATAGQTPELKKILEEASKPATLPSFDKLGGEEEPKAPSKVVPPTPKKAA